MKMPEHPNAVKGYVKEATLVLEKKLGRYLDLPHEFAHHIDQDPSNNEPDNLEAMSRSAHQSLHNGLR